MSHLYEAALAIASVPVSAAVFTIVTAAGTRAEIREITVCETGGVNRVEPTLGRPAANGTGTITGGVLVQALDPGDPAGQTTIVPNAGFGTLQPTAPANGMRRYLAGAVAGTSVTWTWEPGELIIPASSQFVVWNIITTATSSADVYVKLAE